MLLTPPTFPTIPPESFPKLHRHPARYWQRIALATWLLATTGISLQLEVSERLAELLGIHNTESGSIKRLLNVTLYAEHGLVERTEEPIHLVYQERVHLLQLSEHGRSLARALGIQPAESDWQRFRDHHRGEVDQRHTAACLKFAYYFRQKGCQVQVLPKVAGRLKPDLLATDSGESFYLEVETKASDNPNKWQAISQQFGVVRVCLLTEKAEQSMVKKLCALRPPVKWTVTNLTYMAAEENPYYLFSEDG